jgi:Fic family protein
MRVYNFDLELDWELLGALSKLDRFDGSWASLERTEGSSLKHLRTVATVESIGASTRIEGSRLTDGQVESLINDLDVTKLVDRDQQEVAGYYSVLELILDSHNEISITQSNLKSFHKLLLQYRDQDSWHRGNYKQHSNNVVASLPDGGTQILFETTPPGFATEDAMANLVKWYRNDRETHPLIKAGVFSYEFVTIHPFQDGNGRLSRLLITLLLLKAGYRWIEYVSLEHEIERRKKEYYRVLRHCQSQRPGEDISVWVNFYLASLNHVQQKLEAKLTTTSKQANLEPRQKSILIYIAEYPGCQSGEISKAIDAPLPTVKRDLSELLEEGLIARHGSGRGTNYTAR